MQILRSISSVVFTFLRNIQVNRQTENKCSFINIYTIFKPLAMLQISQPGMRKYSPLHENSRYARKILIRMKNTYETIELNAVRNVLIKTVSALVHLNTMKNWLSKWIKHGGRLLKRLQLSLSLSEIWIHPQEEREPLTRGCV